MVLFLLLILYFFIILFDYLPIIRARDVKTAVLYGVILLLSFLVLFLKNMDMILFSPSDPLKHLISDILNLK